MARRKFTEELENALLPLIQFEGADQNHEAHTRALLWFLKRLSRLYGAVVQLRLWLYDRGVLHRHPLGCQVISVGNVTAGGTGKTPMVEKLARDLRDNGRKVAILSRGYRKGAGKTPFPSLPLEVSKGNGPCEGITSEQSGDEPFMLAKNLPGVAVLVDKDRVRSGRHAVRKLDCDTLLLDDGFQYQRLKHRLDLVLVDCGNPFGNGNVLPRGILREPMRNLRRARFICITKVRGRDTAELRRRIRELNPDAGLMECDHVPCLLRDAFTDAEHPLSELRGRRVFALSGIASPRSFETSLEDLGATLLGRHHVADHHRYSRREVQRIVNKARELGADWIVTTEKDAVRIPLLRDCAVPIVYLRIEIRFHGGTEEFERCVGLITNARPEDKTP